MLQAVLDRALSAPGSSSPAESHGGLPAWFREVFTTLELNTLGVIVPNPLVFFLGDFESLERESFARAAAAVTPLLPPPGSELHFRGCTCEFCVEEHIQFDWTAVQGPVFSSQAFPHYRGNGVYPVLSKLNHSCAPNCEVIKENE